MAASNSGLYFAQAFHHGEPDRRSYVISIGSKERVETLAREEHAKQHGEFGIAIYEVVPDCAVQDEPRLVGYLGSVMGECWVAGEVDERVHA